jgi:ribosomal protein S18 acetylase RimI-like enzyme
MDRRLCYFSGMELRPACAEDLAGLSDIDATMESLRYLHIDRTGDGLNLQWKVEDRALRERLIQPIELDDERQFAYRQIITGIEDGLAQVAEHDGQIVAAMAAKPNLARGVLEMIDLRVDFDHRREGLATAMLYHAIQAGRELQLRAVAAESAANNDPANQLLAKLGFHLAGLDALRNSNHDLVKETVTLLWYATLD